MKNYTLFIVDDEKTIREGISADIEDDYRVFSYETAEKALEDFQMKKPDLVLLDIGLPGMNGIQALKTFKEADNQILVIIEMVAKSPDTPILILGETGTGKELIASTIHHRSPNYSGPFVTVNCAAIPKDLIESELFGYEKGAFSGASSTGKKGLIEMADKGTLFLDEIGDLNPDAQAKL